MIELFAQGIAIIFTTGKVTVEFDGFVCQRVGSKNLEFKFVRTTGFIFSYAAGFCHTVVAEIVIALSVFGKAAKLVGVLTAPI